MKIFESGLPVIFKGIKMYLNFLRILALYSTSRCHLSLVTCHLSSIQSLFLTIGSNQPTFLLTNHDPCKDPHLSFDTSNFLRRNKRIKQ